MSSTQNSKRLHRALSAGGRILALRNFQPGMASHNSSAISTSSNTTPSINPQGVPIVTTTIYTSSSSTSTPTSRSGSQIPIAAIAGGAAAGVFLAVTVVLVWVWWGRSIKRKEAKEKQKAFSWFQLRENTRRNASQFSPTPSTYKMFGTRTTSEKKIRFASDSLQDSPNASTPSLYEKDGKDVGSPPALQAPRGLTWAPVRSSPLSQSVTNTGDNTLAQSPPISSNPSEPDTLHPQQSVMETLGVPTLAHKRSTLSTESMYSTQSGEERQSRVPSSLIMAAFGRLDPRRPLSSTYAPTPRMSVASYTEQNRLSQVSAGSANLPSDDQYSGPVGYAA